MVSTICPLVVTESTRSCSNKNISGFKLTSAKTKFCLLKAEIFSKRQSVAFTLSLLASTLTSAVSQEGEGEEKYLWILRIQIHALREMFTGDQKWKLLRPRLFSLCHHPPPSHSCSYTLTKLIYCHSKITSFSSGPLAHTPMLGGEKEQRFPP